MGDRICWCSVVVPTLNEEALLERTLEYLRKTAVGASSDWEIIIADGGSTDQTLVIAQTYGCRIVHSTRGRAPQLNAGARVARGTYLYFLHADTLPPPDWRERLRRVGWGPACFRLAFDRDHPGLRFFSWCSRLPLNAFRYGDQSLYVRREEFLASGGYDERLLVFEDNDLLRRLPPVRILPASVTTSARKYLTNGVWRTQAVYVVLYMAWRLGVGQERLWGWYEKWLR